VSPLPAEFEIAEQRGRQILQRLQGNAPGEPQP
jgi:hypothetical protein